jgi:hypothetical protein
MENEEILEIVSGWVQEKETQAEKLLGYVVDTRISRLNWTIVAFFKCFM